MMSSRRSIERWANGYQFDGSGFLFPQVFEAGWGMDKHEAKTSNGKKSEDGPKGSDGGKKGNAGGLRRGHGGAGGNGGKGKKKPKVWRTWVVLVFTN